MMRATSRWKRWPAVWAKSAVLPATVSRPAAIRYQATPPPWPKKRTTRVVSGPLSAVTSVLPSIEVHGHAGGEVLPDRLQVPGRGPHVPREHVRLVRQRAVPGGGVDDGAPVEE